MDLDSAIDRYLANPDVARWLFSKEDIKTVSAQALDASFVYAIGFGVYDAGTPRTMNIEDMLIVTGTAGNFVLGLVWGLSQPHVFARTPLMLDKKPLSRRFAVDFSSRDALEFMEFVSFDDGKVIVMFRQFLHTHDLSLPVVACARLHAASQVEQSLGPILMRADLFEAASCPACGQAGKRCHCSFESYAPNAAVRKTTYTWNQYASCFMQKARIGVIKLRMTAVLPNVGEMRIMDDEFPVLNVLQRGETEYMALLRRKAVHGLGVSVIMPRSETLVLANSVENDFIDLHNSYVTRKRIRDFDDDPASILLQPEPLDLTGAHDLLSSPGGPAYSDSVESVDDVLSIFPGIFSTGESPRHPDDSVAMKSSAVRNTPMPPLPEMDETVDPFAKVEPVESANLLLTPKFAPPSEKDVLPQPARTHADILNDIELILSPPGSQTQAAPGGQTTQAEPPLELLSNLTNGAALHWASSASSEHSTRIVTHQEVTGAKPTAAKRKRKTAKRTKSQALAVGDSGPDSEKKHACTSCSSRFKMRGDLLRHVKIVHEGKKMYTCETCGKAFGHSGHLNRHVSSVHLQQRRFKCQFCGFQFFQQSHLQSHIGHIHGAKKPFSCEDCGYRASSQNALKTHISEAHSESPSNVLQCPLPGCGETFAFDSDLNVHILTGHRSPETAFSTEPQVTPLPI